MQCPKCRGRGHIVYGSAEIRDLDQKWRGRSATASGLLLDEPIVAVCPVGSPGGEMKRFIIPIGIVVVILVGLAVLTEGSAIAPFLYRNF